MVRVILATLACLLLGACSGWVSDERLFGDGDWAHLDINGRYKLSAGVEESKDRIIFKTRPDGLIESHSTNRRDKSRSLTGLIPIRGGSGEYFLSVDRSNDDSEGDQYFIVHLSSDKRIEYFLPDCRGTPQIDGMEKRSGWHEETAALVEEGPGGSAEQPSESLPVAEPQPESEPAPGEDSVCNFSTKDALMMAGLEAEKFLSAKHIVAIRPLYALEPDDEADSTRHPPPRRSRR